MKGLQAEGKNLLIILSNAERFRKDKDFKNLSPQYNVTAHDIQNFIMDLLKNKK